MLAVVTGGSRGIGAAIALSLADEGYDLAVICHSKLERAEATAANCREKGVRALAFQADVGSEEECRELVAKIHSELGPVDVLVNNAGITRDGLLIRMGLDQFNEVLQTNLTGMFLMCRSVLPDMIKARGGRIINITSVSGIYGNAGQANYAAAKAGVIGLTRSLAKEVGSRQITVNAIAPGFIETDMTAGLPETIKEQGKKAISLGRFGQPEDVASLAAFLASTKAAYITGQVIEVSGGLRL